MKKLTFTLFITSIISLNLFTPALRGNDVLINVQGDVVDAASGTNCTGVIYLRGGNLYYNQFNSNGEWASEVLIGQANEGTIAMDPTGKPHLAFKTPDNKIGYKKYDGNSWTETVLIESNHEGACSKPHIAVDSSGFAHITYTDSKGNVGDYTDRADIMYAVNSSGSFVKTLIFNGYLDYFGGADRYAEYFDKGSFITLDENGNYFIMTHKFQYQTWMGGNDKQYSVVIKSNLGTGGTSTHSSDIFDIYDIYSGGSKVVVLYRQSAFKKSELTVNGNNINFVNTTDITASSVSSINTDGTKVIVTGLNNANLYSNYDSLAHIYTNVTVKGSKTISTTFNNTYYAIYTDNADNYIKVKEIVRPLSIATFSFSSQTKPANINIKEGTISIEVASGTDLTSLVANFSTSADVTSVKIDDVDQVSGVTVNDFSSPVNYILRDENLNNKTWVVNVTKEIASNFEDVNLLNINVYPNPFSSYIMLDNVERVRKVTITNITGVIVMDLEPEGKQMIYTNHLNSGMYLINLELDNGKSLIRKILKR